MLTSPEMLITGQFQFEIKPFCACSFELKWLNFLSTTLVRSMEHLGQNLLVHEESNAITQTLSGQLGLLSGISGLYLSYKAYREGEDKLLVSLRFLAAMRSITADLLNFLAWTHLVVGGLATIFSMLNSIGFAVFMWLAALKAGIEFWEALDNTDTLLLLEYRLSKLEDTQAKLKGKQALRFWETRDALRAQRKILMTEVSVLTKVHAKELQNQAEFQSMGLVPRIKAATGLDVEQTFHATETEQKLAAALKKNQQEQAFSKGLNFMFSIGLAVGASISAAALVCPYLFLVGTGIFAATLLLKLMLIGMMDMLNYLARQNAMARLIKNNEFTIKGQSQEAINAAVDAIVLEKVLGPDYQSLSISGEDKVKIIKRYQREQLCSDFCAAVRTRTQAIGTSIKTSLPFFCAAAATTSSAIVHSVSPLPA